MGATIVALPDTPHAQVAEGRGCEAAFHLVSRLLSPGRPLTIAGDNLAVVRHGAGVGRIRRPEIQSCVEAPLMDSLELGHTHSWIAVRRHHNQFADRLATIGVYWAHRLRSRGNRHIRSLSLVLSSDTLRSQRPPPGAWSQALLRTTSGEESWLVDVHIHNHPNGRRDIVALLPERWGDEDALYALLQGAAPQLLHPGSELSILDME